MADVPVTALCPTYGRFERLRGAVACFLLQDYRPRRLLVLNDAPEPLRLRRSGGRVLRLPGATVELWNNPVRYRTLGHKRQALLTAARGELACHWDDDDWYLPWHLRQCVDALKDAEAECVKPGAAWWVTGSGGGLSVGGPRHNVFEGQMAFDRRAAVELGGYSPKDSGQAKDLLNRFHDEGLLRLFDPEPGLSYCYRWSGGVRHVSAAGSGAQFADGNRDFGGGRPLIPADSDPLSWARDRMRPDWGRFMRRLPEGAARRRMEKTLAEHL
ncbi:MAG: glycosyltransferase family A protein [Planctomycetota bacterium]